MSLAQTINRFRRIDNEMRKLMKNLINTSIIAITLARTAIEWFFLRMFSFTNSTLDLVLKEVIELSIIEANKLGFYRASLDII